MRSLNHPNKEQGQALVEFALMLPILVLLLMAIMDFSRIMFVYAQLSNSAREAARFGSVIGNDPDDPRYFDCDAITAAAEEALLFSRDIDVVIQYDDGVDVKFDCGAGDDIEEYDRIRVTVTATVDFMTPGMSAGVVNFLFGDDGLTMKFSAARTIWIEGIVITPENQ